MAHEPYPIISVRGDAYNRGYQHGSQAGELIRKNVEYYLHLWETYSDMDRDYVLELAGKFVHPIEKYDGQILRELEGVAAGVGISLEEVLALNARYELVWAKLHEKKEALQSKVTECTSIAANPQAASNGHTLIGQNWDYHVAVRDRCLLLEIEQGDRPNIVIHTEAGIVGQKGMNSAGIGFCVNALLSEEDGFEPKVPFWVMCRGILNSETLEEAQDAVLKADRSGSGNCLIASDGGEVVDLESTPKDVGVVSPVDGRLAHGNTFADLREERHLVDKFKALYPHMPLRPSRAQALMARDPLDVEAFKEILRDHDNAPESICRHQDSQTSNGMAEESLTSIIMDLTDRVLYITNGPPCQSEYKKLTFQSLKKT